MAGEHRRRLPAPLQTEAWMIVSCCTLSQNLYDLKFVAKVQPFQQWFTARFTEYLRTNFYYGKKAKALRRKLPIQRPIHPQ